MQSTTAQKSKVSEIKEDVWIHSCCDMCFCQCGIIVHRVDGVVVKIEGDPDCPHNNGKVCAKGQAGLMNLYDPHRLTKPMKRTNPEKGIGIDPGWQEISWDEALDIVAEKLKKIREDDPRKLVMSTFDGPGIKFIGGVWGPAFETPNTFWVGYFCGNYLHSSMYLTNGTFHSDYDIDHCNYVILLGNQSGFMVGLSPMITTQKMAEARMRGMKVVAIDPICTNAGAKADEWIPIRPGTDGAFMNGMVNVLVNEMGVYDADFIKRRTNGAYLVGPDGHYVKEGEKPLVWDVIDNVAKPFDGDIKDFALDGTFNAQGIECRPAFHYFKENAKEYSPEMVSEITSIPADTIRRIAREFGEASTIGSTTMVEGQVIPHRPAAVNIYRGAGAHKHGVITALAVQSLNMVMGNFYAVGGHRGMNLVGPGEKWGPGMSSDGMIMPAPTIGEGVDYYDFEVGPPQSVAMNELLPISTNRSAMIQQSIMDPERFKLPYTPEMLMVCRRNLMTNNASPKKAAEMFKKIPFITYFAMHIDELAEFADILLPEQHSMERLDLFPNQYSTSISNSTGYFYWGVRQPVVEPAGEARQWTEVLLEIADRVGFLDEVNRIMNVAFELKDPYLLDPAKKYTLAEVYDRQAHSMFGPDMGLDWFREHGYHKIKRTVGERYPGTFITPRFPIYFENILRAGEDIKKATDEMGIEWNIEDYNATIRWQPCPAFSKEPRDDFYAVNYKLPFHTFSYTIQNPWLNELGRHHPYAYKVLMNADAAKKRGIADGETVRLESEAGSTTGAVKLTEGIHPEVLGIAGIFGSWAKGKPIAQGTGIHFNTLLPIDLEHTDWVSGGLDSCVRVKVSKIS